MSDALLVSFSGAVDMALRCPEVGSVNFNLLNAVLQAMIHQMRLNECSVEIRGPETECLKKLMATANSTLSVELTDYSVNYDPRKKDPSQNKQKKETENTWNIVVVDTKKETDASKKDTVHQPHVIVPVSDERFQKLESSMEYLKVKMKEILELPNDSNIVEAMRSLEHRGADQTSVLNPASEMWQMLSLSKRLDAAEAGITQLTNTIDAFMNEVMDTLYNEPENRVDETLTAAYVAENQRNDAPELKKTSFVKSKQNDKGSKTNRSKIDTPKKERARSQSLNIAQERKLSTKVDRKNVSFIARNDTNGRASRLSTFSTVVQRLDALEKKMEMLPNLAEYERPYDYAPPPSPSSQNEDTTQISEQLDMLKRTVNHHESVMIGVCDRLADLTNIEVTLNEVLDMKTRIDQIEEALDVLNSTFNNKLKDFTSGTNTDPSKRIEEKIMLTVDKKLKALNEEQSRCSDGIQNHVLIVERDLSNVQEQVTSLMEQQDDKSAITDIINRVEQLQEDMTKISTAAEDMVTGQAERKEIFQKILDDIEDMKILKADRQDIDEALLEKADTDIMKDHLSRKVSHQHFEDVYEEIRNSFQNAADRLREQEELWFQTLEEIQFAVGSKIDKIDEIEPLRHNVNQKIKGLQAQLKILNESREEKEAAAAKKRIIRDMTCLSCDKPVFMKKFNQHSLFPAPPIVSDKLSMRPYLAYELDAVRQQKRCLAQGRNLNFLEQAVKQNKPTKEKPNQTLRPGHLCNRYCGGSHTITTPQQRVTYAKGHCHELLGPKIIPISGCSYMVGTDGKVYKSNVNAETSSHSSKSTSPTCNMFFHTPGGSSEPSTEPKSTASSSPKHQGAVQKIMPSDVIPRKMPHTVIGAFNDDDDGYSPYFGQENIQDAVPKRVLRNNSLLRPTPITLETIVEETSSLSGNSAASSVANPTVPVIEPLDLSGLISPPECIANNSKPKSKPKSKRVTSLMKLHINKAASTRDSVTKKIDTTALKPSLAKRPSTRRGSAIARQQTTELSGNDLLDPIKNPIPPYYLPDPNKLRFGNRPDHNEMVLVTLENYDHVKAIDRPIIPERVADRERLVKEEKMPTKNTT